MSRTFLSLMLCGLMASLTQLAVGQEASQAPSSSSDDETAASEAPAAPDDDVPPPGDDSTAPADDQPDVPPEKLEVIKERYPNGAVRVERHVFQDEKGNYVMHGPWTMWYPDGKKIGGGEFRHGLRHGVWSRWFGPGEGPMFANPLYREYRGPFQSEATFLKGKLHGPWILIDSNKTKISEWHFENGKQHGLWSWWYPSGQKRREATYLDGVLHGKVREWAPDGKLLADEEFIHGRRRYQRVWWHAPKQKQSEGWYLSGKPMEKTVYDWWEGVARTDTFGQTAPDARHGLWTWWYRNGQTRVEGKFVENKPVGVWTWWHPDGQVHRTKDYKGASAPAEQPADGAPAADSPSQESVPANEAPADAQAAPSGE